MKYYLAPMEGLTGYVFRQTHHMYYAGFDKYFTPFISPTKKRVLKTRELKDISPANNTGMTTVPQILTNDASNFIYTTSFLANEGYREVNLNLGCPSPTVVSKNKGAGFLSDPERLDRFFDEVFNGVDKDIKISVKTRLGMCFASEFEDILKVYNRYPISELIIHPRVRDDYYNGSVKMDVFGEALKNTSISVCYNGDIFDASDALRIAEDCPNVNAIMLGRGILRNPGLINEIKGIPVEPDSVISFHNTLLEKYLGDLKSERDVLFKMKELWSYLAVSFNDNPEHDKLLKKIRKSSNISEYRIAVNELIK